MDKDKELLRIISRRRLAYANVFKESNRGVKVVLEDLSAYCRENESTFTDNALKSAFLEGRRDVLLRIKDYSTLNNESLLAKYR